MQRARFSAFNLPEARNDRQEPMIYNTPDGTTLCAKHARRYVLHMVGRKVSGFICHGSQPMCELCHPMDGD